MAQQQHQQAETQHSLLLVSNVNLDAALNSETVLVSSLSESTLMAEINEHLNDDTFKDNFWESDRCNKTRTSFFSC